MADRTIIDYFAQTGIFGEVSLVVFIAGLLFAILIHFRRLGLRFRMALVPFSLLPLMVGIFGATLGTIDATRAIRSCSGYNPEGAVLHFGEMIQIMVFASAEAAILLFLASLLFLSRYALISDMGYPQSEQGGGANPAKPGGSP